MIITSFPDVENSPHWPAIRKLLEPAAKLGGIEVKEESDLVWVAIDKQQVWAAFTTRLVGDTLEIRCAGGTRLKEWMARAERIVCRFARQCHATGIEGRGRKGWTRFKDRFGWRLDRIEDGRPVFRKEL